MSSKVFVLAVLGLSELLGAETIRTIVKISNSQTLEGKRFEELHPDITTIVY